MKTPIKYRYGQVIGKCIYLHDVPKTGKQRKAKFKCKCGNTFDTTVCNVKSGTTISCGCHIKAMPIKHGLCNTSIYNRWLAMKSRCYYKKNISYHNYGGRGITVYDKWKTNFKIFYNYVMSLENAMKPELTIDRINNSGNYEPNNIKWSNREEQSINRRIRKSNNSGYIGIYLTSSSNYRAFISINKKRVTIGTYNTIEMAIKARNNFIIKMNLIGHIIQNIDISLAYKYAPVDDETIAY